MNPLDSIKKTTKKDSRIYRSKNRVNFLVDTEKAARPVKRRPVDSIERPEVKKYTLVKIILISLLIILVSGAMYLSEKVFSSGDSSEGLSRFNPFTQLAKLVTSGDKKIDGEKDDRINILALGIGGEGHDGPLLTDTIIVMSIKPSTGEVGLVSVPRDMAVEMRDGNWYKINQIYSMGKAQKKDEGIEYITQAVEDTLGVPIHYWGVVTFQGFVDFIDEIGGISVDVPVSFVDTQYPTDDYKVQTVSFEAGLQTMYGDDALIFARSRHGSNFENSDFARSRRQQLILQAIKDKMFRFSTLLSPQKISAIFDLLGNHINTNISVWQGIKIMNMVKDTAENKIYKIVLDDAPDSILEPGYTEEGQWVLVPKDGNFDTLARQFNNIFNEGILKSEAAKIEIQNGTETPGLAFWTSVNLQKLGYTVTSYINAATQDYQRTVIYDLSDDKKPNTLKWLKDELQAYLAKPVPDYIIDKYRSSVATSTELLADAPDIIAVLGLDHAYRFKLPEEEEETASTTEEIATSTHPIFLGETE